MSTVLIILAITTLVVAGWALLKGKQPTIVLLFAGLTLSALTLLLEPSTQILDEEASSGSRWIDLLGQVETISADQLSGVGLIIMAASGFSAYMKKIGATRALVEVVARPIARLHHPILLLVLCYFIGQALFMVIPSAAGLALLLLVSLFPILTNAGVSPASAGAMIVSVSALPVGPGTGTEILAAQTMEVSPTVFFVRYQLPVAVPTMIVIAAALALTQRYFDARQPRPTATTVQEPAATSDSPAAPGWYACFVVLPVILLIIFSPLTNDSIELSTVTAFIAVWVLAVLLEAVRHREISETFTRAKAFFTGMGSSFGSVVCLIIAAQVFAESLKLSGLIDGLISLASGANFGVAAMALVLMLIVGAVTYVTGSGVGAFSAFAPLAPQVAHGVSGSMAALLIPMQLAGGLFRSMSPIAGVMIAVSGSIGTSPANLAKRTTIPMVAGIVTMSALSLIVL